MRTAKAVAIAAGYSHTCAVTSAARAECWGYNGHGELGDGTTTDRLRPVAVAGLGLGVRAVAAGAGHTCALTRAGGVECWGSNRHGELGDGTTTRRLTPVAVIGLRRGVQAIAAGEGFGCALTSAGRVECWGDNAHGELGDGTTTDRQTPVSAAGLAGRVRAIAVGYFHACALTSVGGVECWGFNAYGQLGDGTTIDRDEPVRVSGLSRVAAITAGGGHSCALTRAGGVECWGSNHYGELGDGTTTRRLTPVAVSRLARSVAEIAAGGEAHGCALTKTGGVECWGFNGHGQLGDGTTTDRHVPVDVAGLAPGVRAISAGGYGHSCALTRTGAIECWGRNSSGQLGDGTSIERRKPVRVALRSPGARPGSRARSGTRRLPSARRRPERA